MILKKISLIIIGMLLIACSLEAKDGLKHGVKTDFRIIGANCSTVSRIAESFPKKYVKFSKKIPAELWIELEFYDCQMVGTYFLGKTEYRYRINSSGAGIFWVPDNEDIEKIFLNCDEICRTKLSWPFAIEPG